MLTDKTTQVRKYILDQIENGDLDDGARIPPARDLATTLGVTFLKVQQALETLVQDGILESRPRQGTFVRPGWQNRILHDNLSIFNYRYRLPWLDGLEARLTEALPALRFTHAFQGSVIEYKTTLYVQTNQHSLLDLSSIFEECFPDESAFFEAPFQPFRIGNRLVGIPFIFSPRVIYYNPQLFRQAGLPLPADDWAWSDLLDAVAALKRLLPANRVINWYVQPHMWMNLVKRAGGALLHPEQPDRVLLDSPETRHGLRLYRELGDLLGNPSYDDDAYRRDFLDGKAAMVLAGRQFMSYLHLESTEHWATAPLPLIPGGDPFTSQSTDVICVRDTCIDLDLVRDYLRVMLSPAVQDYIADQHYGIPIRRSSAARALSPADPRDAVFASEMHRLASEPASSCPGLIDFLAAGVDRLLLQQDDIDRVTGDLAHAARVLIQTHDFRVDQQLRRARGDDPLAVSPRPARLEMFR